VANPGKLTPGSRPVIFLYNLLITALLALLAIAYLETDFADWLPDELQGLPVYAVWFGSLGGVVISMKGVYDHATDWGEEWALWHYGRPFSAAIVGGMTYVLLRAVNTSSDLSVPVVEAAAFILGTQEKRFFDLLYEVARVIVTVPTREEQLLISDVQPTAGAPGSTVAVVGQGFKPGLQIRLGNTPLEDVVVSTDGHRATGKVPEGSGTVDLVAANQDGSAYVRRNAFTFEGQGPSDEPDEDDT
jgi:hypothetical protein